MQTVLVDKLIVPEESKPAFLERTRIVQSFIRTLPGFVEGFLYEKKDGESPYNFMAVAVWESKEAFEKARETVTSEYQKQGYNPQEVRKQLKITSERDICERSSY